MDKSEIIFSVLGLMGLILLMFDFAPGGFLLGVGLSGLVFKLLTEERR